MLAGGPGASGLDGLKRSETSREIAFYRSIADGVVFDQRGAGRSTPRLDCPQTARQLLIVEGGNHGALYNLYGRWQGMHQVMRDFLSGLDVRLPKRVVMPWVYPETGAGSHE